MQKKYVLARLLTIIKRMRHKQGPEDDRISKFPQAFPGHAFDDLARQMIIRTTIALLRTRIEIEGCLPDTYARHQKM